MNETQNYCLDSAATASASSEYGEGFPASSAIDGDRAGRGWGNKGGWGDQTRDAGPDWLDVDFGKERSVGRVVVFTLPDNYPAEPDETTPATVYGIEDFTVELRNSFGGVVATQAFSGNDRAMVEAVFPAGPRARRVRVTVTKWRANYSRVVEVEAYPPR
jgi:hypothetical protein